MENSIDKASILQKLESELKKSGSIILNGIAGRERTIVGIKESNIVYMSHNEKCKLYYSIDVFIRTCKYFSGKTITTTSLREYDDCYKVKKPCNAVVFFLLLNFLFNIEIYGEGTRGKPYYASVI